MRRWAKRMVVGCLVGWGMSCCSWRWSSLCVVFGGKKGIIWEMEDTIYLLFFLSSERIAVHGTSLTSLQYHVVAVRIALKQRRELRGGAWTWVFSQEVEKSCLAGVGWILFYWKSSNIS